jgi:hypothetical protein
MATKTFYATGSFKYGTRMMTAGDAVEMDGPTARLYTALRKISPDKPRAAKVATAPVAPVAPPPSAPTATAPKRKTTKKRATKKAK